GTSHTLSISGGNEKTNYRATVDYRMQNGVDRYSSRKEFGGRASINHTTKGGLFNITLNLAPRIVDRKISSWDVFRNALEANPTTPIWEEENVRYTNFTGQTAGYNPVELMALEDNTATTKLLETDATVKLNIFPLFAKDTWPSQTLTTQVTVADHEDSNFNYWFRPSTSTLAINNGYDGEGSRSYDKGFQRSLEWLTNYTGSFSDHNVKAMAGYSYQYNQYSGMSAENKDFPNDGLGSNSLGTGQWALEEGHVGMGSYKNDSKLIAFFGRVSYDWKSRYILTASLRHEGSSRFGANHKWGNFPAVSAGWRISDEPFMNGLSWINDLKLRADYGETGNQDFSSYMSLNTMTGFGYYYYNGQYYQVWGPAKNVNPDLHWEKAKNWNIGLDFSVLDAKLTGSLNYYNRRQQDLLGDYDVSVPPYLFSTTFVNVGTMRNSGFEFDLRWNAVTNRDFTYTVDFVGATMDNKFVDFSNTQYVGQDYYDVVGTEDPYPFHNLQRIQKGERLGNFYMYRYAGIDDEGNWAIYDKEGNIKLASEGTEDDRQIVGNGLPKFTASMTHTFRYRNFDLSLFFRGAFGYDIFNIHDFYYG
ncbi:MAG: TonB-dependent receptor, partial [Muribaculaceae bacterium]|nr:TonB-dependent receptor [Muribaculaceae bacterium]